MSLIAGYITLKLYLSKNININLKDFLQDVDLLNVFKNSCYSNSIKNFDYYTDVYTYGLTKPLLTPHGLFILLECGSMYQHILVTTDGLLYKDKYASLSAMWMSDQIIRYITPKNIRITVAKPKPIYINLHGCSVKIYSTEIFRCDDPNNYYILSNGEKFFIGLASIRYKLGPWRSRIRSHTWEISDKFCVYFNKSIHKCFRHLQRHRGCLISILFNDFDRLSIGNNLSEWIQKD